MYAYRMGWPYVNQMADRSNNALAYQAREANSTKIHRCLYMLMRRTIKMTGSHQQWAERCRCGRIKVVDWNMMGDGLNSPTMVKHWFDVDGSLHKKTGYLSASDLQIASTIRAEAEIERE